MFDSRLNKFLILSITFHLLGAAVLATFLYKKNILIKADPIIVDFFNLPSPDKKKAEQKQKIMITKPNITASKERIFKKKIIEKNQVYKSIVNKNEIYTEIPVEESVSNIEDNANQSSKVSEVIDETSTVNFDKKTILAYPNYKVNPKPNYPMIARRRGYEGEVLVKVWVLKNGKVGDMELERPSGYSILDNSALDAIKEWEFIPGKKNGQPVSSWVTVPISFRLKSG